VAVVRKFHLARMWTKIRDTAKFATVLRCDLLTITTRNGYLLFVAGSWLLVAEFPLGELIIGLDLNK